MARPLKPLVKSGGYYPSNRWTPLVYPGGYTTENGGGQPEPEAVLKTVTGSLIHITDALALPAEALSVNVEPIQDLHGYDSPWPAGGGANEFYYGSNISPTTTNGVTISYDKDTESFAISGENTKTDGAYIHTSLAPNSYEFPTLSVGQTVYVYSNLPLNTYINITYRDANNINRGFPIIGGAGGSGDWKLTSFVVPSDFVKLNNVQIGIYKEARQLSATGVKIAVGASQFTAWSPYSNICPISGRTSATVTRAGVNVWDEVWEPGTLNASTGAEVNSAVTMRSKNFISIKSGETYTPVGPYNVVNTNQFILCFYDINNTFVFGRALAKPEPFTVPSNDAIKYMRFAYRYYLNDSGGTYNNDVSINYPASDTQYHPYQGNTYTIQLGDTVYGGTLDVTAGKMVVDRAMKVFSGSSSEGWVKSDYGYFSTGKISGAIDRNAARSDFQSNLYAYGAISNNSSTLGGCLIWGFVRVRLADMSISLDDWKAQLASTPMQVVYTLATPIEITLTPTQIEMSLGENNLWADAGDSTLTYYADGNASEIEALNILLGNRYYNNHEADEPTDREALDILLGNTR